MKLCAVCRTEKQESEFYKHKASKDGLSRVCKMCNAARGAEYRRLNAKELSEKQALNYLKTKEHVNARNNAYRRANIEIARARESAYYYANAAVIAVKAANYRRLNKDRIKEMVARWAEQNRGPILEYQAAYRVNNKERINARISLWQKANSEAMRAAAHRRRARTAAVGGAHTAQDIKSLMLLQKGKCAYCKISIKGKKYEVDHVMPIKLGGSNGKANLQLLCPTCNRRKGAKHPVDFVRSIGMLL